MFIQFFENLRHHKVPVSLREYLTFLKSVSIGLCTHDVNQFYYLGRIIMVKDERHLDKFDRAFSKTFAGIETLPITELIESLDVPEAWLKKLTEKVFDKNELEKIEALGGFEKLMETLKKRLEEQEKRHQGGSKWIGTAGTSPFGAYGYNPEGVRVGQDKSRHQRAVKVWDKREFKNLDDTVELGTRNIKVAMKRLRQWVRNGAEDELDLQGTIRSTAEKGYLDVKTRSKKRNAVKLLLFLDIGGSMDPYIRLVEELFSAANAEFKNLEHYYFHNCLYEGVWKDNARRWEKKISTWEILNTYGSDYKCIFVGDASMSAYEIIYPGGANEYWNEEPGSVWLERARSQWPSNIWINPLPISQWKYTQSVEIIKDIFQAKMFPLNLNGIDEGMKTLRT